LLQQDPERYDIPIPVYQSINQSINQQSINHLLLRIYSKQNKLCAWRHVMPRPSTPRVGIVAPRAAEPTAAPADGNVAAVSHAQYVPTLTVAARA